jgi:hypothetical protein
VSGTEPTNAVRERLPFWANALGVVGFAALAGPLIGSMAFIVFMIFAKAASEGIEPANAMTTLILGPLVIAPLGYALGLPPAVGSGLIFVFVDTLAPPWTPRWLLTPAIGAATTTAYVGLITQRDASGSDWIRTAPFAAIGAFAASVCWYASERMGLTMRKPTLAGAPK